MLDGFIELNSQAKSSGAELNVHFLRNLVSPFSNLDATSPTTNNNNLIVDQYYGLAFDDWIQTDLAIYGKTEELPAYSGEELANYGFLRVPYRRIPRRLIRNRAELEKIVASIWSADSDLRLFFRGQNREYYLNRSKTTLRKLFGDENALEPSLLPSASRRNIELQRILPEWSAVVQLFITKAILRENPSSADFDVIRSHNLREKGKYQFMFFLLALAQHYGLPSAGLDVTDKLDIALFFALTEFRPSPNKRRTLICRRLESTEPSVIYLISTAPRQYINYRSFHPDGLEDALRPNRQHAYFLHTAWGLNKNNCSRYIFLALYLDPDGDFGQFPSAMELFPSANDDGFGGLLEDYAGRNLPAGLAEFLDYFSWVQSE